MLFLAIINLPPFQHWGKRALISHVCTIPVTLGPTENGEFVPLVAGIILAKVQNGCSVIFTSKLAVHPVHFYSVVIQES